MSMWHTKAGNPPAWMWALLGISAVGTVVVVGSLVKSKIDGPRPTPGGGTVTPGAPPAPGAIPPAADLIEHAGHDIYLWEVLDANLDFVEWRYVTLDPSGLVFDSGVIKTPSVTGAEETKAAAIAKIDTKFVP